MNRGNQAILVWCVAGLVSCAKSPPAPVVGFSHDRSWWAAVAAAADAGSADTGTTARGGPLPPRRGEGATEAQRPAVPSPGSERLSEFASALSSYSSSVDRFASLPDEAPAALSHAFDSLADAVAAIPRVDELAGSEVGGNLRTLAENFRNNPPLSPGQATVARDVFRRAQIALSQVAQQQYAGAQDMMDDVLALGRQSEAIDPTQPLSDQLPQVLRALEGVERVLRGMAMTGPARKD
jgi:hypothetical protein